MHSVSTRDDPPRVLAPYVRVGFQDGALFLGFGSIRRPVHDRTLWEPLLRLAGHFHEPRTRAEARSFLDDLCEADTSRAEAVMRLLDDGNHLISAHAYDPADRYSRHSLFYELSGADAVQVQLRLARARVVLLGCGGIGSLVAVTLATAGVGELVLVDADHVELSNLTRQFLFTEADIGLPKAEVLARELQRRNRDCRVLPAVRDVGAGEDLEGLPDCDLFVVSADSPGLTGTVNAYCVRNGTPWMNACYVNDIAVWGPLVIPGATGCWDCRPLTAGAPEGEAELSRLVAGINGRYQAPSNGPVNMLASSLAALDALRYLGGFGTPASLNRRMGVWSHDLMLDGQDTERDPDCSTCAAAVPVREGVR
ncbi:Molybdopterin or thiamine biosynthesis adenylyltransferase [Nocardiopsis flavescens]|uniref:Molybdopterin or thiamine biosynthesis adenylyltransferase n=1 Tax=Nocardiopsis flavescens TaxID=758803 RepID=A0A1M6TEW2_9ACTN|nr:ThiF family adenylyltransferase [Nocardiopsis flavescens]SHK55308.1 Molybdopterin or thiamine biosynthesis adenylyltransferase [Nocardiopsis flavescens]